MPSLKDLKIRIGSVGSTKKITSAMKVVSASKFSRAKDKANSSYEYSYRLADMTVNAIKYLGVNKSKLMHNDSSNKHLMLVISSDRGLCGGLNTHLLKTVKSFAERLKSQGKQFEIICVGKKAKDLLSVHYKKYINSNLSMLSKDLNYTNAEDLLGKILEKYNKNEFDVCNIFYNKFISAISQVPEYFQIIPYHFENNDTNETDSFVYEAEPNAEILVEELVIKNITMQLYNAILQNYASEHGARMSAMDNATRNASEMIKALTLQYNRARQAVITKELIEIISGAEAV